VADKRIKLDDLIRLLGGDAATPDLRMTDAGPVYLCEVISPAAGNAAAGRLQAHGYTPRPHGLAIVVAAEVEDSPATGLVAGNT
jgi:hypothetical protein